MAINDIIFMVIVAVVITAVIVVVQQVIKKSKGGTKMSGGKSNIFGRKKPEQEMPEDYDNSQATVQIRRKRINSEENAVEENSGRDLIMTVLLEEDDDDEVEVFDLTRQRRTSSVRISLLDDIENVPLVDEVEEKEPEPIPLEEQLIDPENKVINRLNLLHLRLSKNRIEAEGDTDGLRVVYTEGAPPIVINNGFMGLRPMKVYADGFAKKWDEYAEVKLPAGKVVEIEFGVGFKFPSDYKMILEPVGNLTDKFALRFAMDSVEMQAVDAQVPLLMKVLTNEGSYVSKTGILFDAHLEENEIEDVQESGEVA